jgi:hypothetical protein
MQDIEDLLAHADAFLSDLVPLYNEALAARDEGRRLRPMIGTILKEQRAAIDFMATAIYAKYGTRGGRHKPGYPFAKTPQGFPKAIDRSMPGVRSAQPDVADAIGLHQPYSPNHEWLRWLNGLRTQVTHAKLVAVELEDAGGFGTDIPPELDFGVQSSAEAEAGGQALPSGPQYTGWRFLNPSLPVLDTLHQIQEGVTSLVADVCGVAGL